MWRLWCSDAIQENLQVLEENVVEEQDVRMEERPKNKTRFLPPEAKQIILNVFNSLRERRRQDNKDELIKETADLTKTSYGTVWRILNVGIQPRKFRSDKGVRKKLLEKEHAHIIRRII